MRGGEECDPKTVCCDIVLAFGNLLAERLLDDDPSCTVTYEENRPPVCPLRSAVLLNDLQKSVCPLHDSVFRDQRLPSSEVFR